MRIKSPPQQYHYSIVVFETKRHFTYNKDMIYENGKIFIDGKFTDGGFEVEDGRFKRVFSGSDSPKPEEKVDLQGAYVIPGLVDIHIHGAAGEDFSSGSPAGLSKMAAFLASCGVTSFLPTAMTLPKEEYLRIADLIANNSDEDLFTDNTEAGLIGENTDADLIEEKTAAKQSARILGMRMEGPFLSKEKCGAQNPAYLQMPDYPVFQEIFARSKGSLKVIDVAPELPGASDFITKASKNCVVSLAHSDAGYEEALEGFESGAKHVTHLYNAMPTFHHRNPGLIGAAWDSKNVTAEIIGDGIHVHESAIRTAFRMMPGRICLISDGLCCMGMSDGEYELTGQKIILRDGAAYLSNGTLAGARSDLFSNLKNLISFGISVEEAVTAATKTPADVIGNETVGAIEEGRFADFIICDLSHDIDDVTKLELREVYVGGQK